MHEHSGEELTREYALPARLVCLQPAHQNSEDDVTSKLQKHLYLCFRRRKFNR